MDKIIEALKKLIPADQVQEVAKALEEVLNEEVSNLESEFQKKLDQAYEQLTEEKLADEAVALKGYQQASEIILAGIRDREADREVAQEHINKGFAEALAELEKEKAKNANLEAELLEEFDNKLKEMAEIMVDKVDAFLDLQEAEIYEHAKRDVLSDPRVLEQRVAVSKMAEILSDYMSNDDYSAVSNAKVEEAQRQIEDLKARLRIVETKNFNLSRQNTKLSEQVNEAQSIITEAAKLERKERVNKSRTASGRGQRVVNETIINEFNNTTNNSGKADQQVNEASDAALNDLLVLSGLEQSY